MSANRKLKLVLVPAISLLMALPAPPLLAQQPPAATIPNPPAENPAAADANVEVLARGPVHEAFAEPVNLQGIDPIKVEKTPPQTVEEMPPDQKLEGENVQWIAGYWAWDDDRDDYIWISGVWRDVPPGQRWVPGYWNDNRGTWTWTPGFWASEKVNEIEYLPEPPQTLEEGPPVAAPSENHVWLPGTWRYHQTRYVWQPGSWVLAQPDYVWVPARYIWCPSGYIFVDSYRDYPLERRGVLFAPVYYRAPIFARPHYYYTPSVVISTSILTVHLFARPRYCHYYFGDYYAPHYRQIGIEPWLMIPRIRGCYDPLFTYYRWHHRRHGRDWHHTLKHRYDFFSKHKHYRPAHTYADLRRQRFDFDRHRDHDLDANIKNIVVNQNNLAVNLNQYVERSRRDRRDGIDTKDNNIRDNNIRFAKIDDSDRRDFAQRAQHLRNFQKHRTQVENAGNVATTGPNSDRDNLRDRGQRGRRTLNLAELSQPGNEQRVRDGNRRRPQIGTSSDPSATSNVVTNQPNQTDNTKTGDSTATNNSQRDRNNRARTYFNRSTRNPLQAGDNQSPSDPNAIEAYRNQRNRNTTASEGQSPFADPRINDNTRARLGTEDSAQQSDAVRSQFRSRTNRSGDDNSARSLPSQGLPRSNANSAENLRHDWNDSLRRRATSDEQSLRPSGVTVPNSSNRTFERRNDSSSPPPQTDRRSNISTQQLQRSPRSQQLPQQLQRQLPQQQPQQQSDPRLQFRSTNPTPSRSLERRSLESRDFSNRSSNIRNYGSRDLSPQNFGSRSQTPRFSGESTRSFSAPPQMNRRSMSTPSESSGRAYSRSSQSSQRSLSTPSRSPDRSSQFRSSNQSSDNNNYRSRRHRND